MKTKPVNNLESKLEIDRTDLESCLMEQARLFYEVAYAATEATSSRDALKLDIEELHASLDRAIRETAAGADEKITEAGIVNRIKLDQKMQKLQQDFLEAKVKTDQLNALKEAFHQRSYMLRELVALELKRLAMEGDLVQAERGATELRNKQGEVIARKAGELRREKLKLRNKE